MFRSAVRQLFAPKPCAPARRAGLGCETLEDRAVPATLTVDADGGRQFLTIQAAVDAAGTSDTVLVYNRNAAAPGAADYQELVNVPAGKTGLKLKAAEAGVVLGAAAGTGAGDAIVDVQSTKVVVEGFTIDGAGANVDAGVRITGGGAATVKGNTIANVVSTNPQFGIGVQVGTQAGSKGTADIKDNAITGYSGAGVLVDGAQANATVKGNAIVGRGAANAGVDQFGVQVSRGASARVESNDISNNTANNSAGVFVFQTGKKVVVAKNDVFDNGYGIYFQNVTGGNGRPEILNNDLTNNDGFAALVLDASTGIDVKNNDLNGGAGDGILLFASDDNSIKNNKVRNFAGDGVYLGDSDGNEVKNNDVFGNGLNGIDLEGSNNNWLWNNTTHSNAVDGMTIKNGVGNDIWLSTSYSNVEDGISLYNADGTTIVGNCLGSNGGAGLRLVDSQGVLIAFNMIQNNGGGAIVVDAASTYCAIGNRTDEGITMEAIGSNYNSLSYLASLGTTEAEGVVADETDTAA